MKDSRSVVPVSALVDLARRAKSLDEGWVQRSLLAVAVTGEQGLAQVLQMHLGYRALMQELDPYPFDTPTEEEFA